MHGLTSSAIPGQPGITGEAGRPRPLAHPVRLSGRADRIGHMTSHEAPEAEMLPGLRAAVDDARAKAAATRRRTAAQWQPAETDPVARVLVDIALATSTGPSTTPSPRRWPRPPS